MMIFAVAISIVFLIVVFLSLIAFLSWSGFKRRYGQEAVLGAERLVGVIYTGDQKPKEQLDFEQAVEETSQLLDRVEKSKTAFDKVNISAPEKPTNPDVVLKYLEGMGPIMIVGAEMFVRQFLSETKPVSIPDALEKLKELGVEYINIHHNGIDAAKNIYEFSLDKFQDLVGSGAHSINDMMDQLSEVDFVDLTGNFSDTAHLFVFSELTGSVSGGMIEVASDEMTKSLLGGIVDYIPVSTIIFGVIREYKIQKNTNKMLYQSVEDVARDTGYVAVGSAAGHLLGYLADLIIPGSQTILIILGTLAGSVFGGTKAREKRMEGARNLEQKLKNNIGLMESEFQELNLALHQVWQKASVEATDRFHSLLGQKAVPSINHAELVKISERLQLIATHDVQKAYAYVENVEKDVFRKAAGINPLLHLLKVFNMTPDVPEFNHAVFNVKRAIETMQQEIPTREMILENPEHSLNAFSRMAVFARGNLVPEFNLIRRNALHKVNADFSQSLSDWETNAALGLTDSLLYVAASLRPHIESIERARKKWGEEIKKIASDLRQAVREAGVKDDKVEQILQRIDLMFGGTSA